MKIYHSKQFGFEMKVPRNWPLPVRVGPEGLVFMNLINESFNFQIGPLYPERLTHDTETLFTLYAQSQGHTELEFGRIRVRNRNYVWARYKMADGWWTKKYMLVIGFMEYAITGTCPDKETFLKREPVWDSMIESFRLTESQEQRIWEQKAFTSIMAGPLYQKAYEAVGDERFSDARVILEQCLSENPENALVHKELAFVLRKLGDLKVSLHHRREVKRLNPTDTVNRFNLSALLQILGDKEGALRETEELIAMEPDNPFFKARKAEMIDNRLILRYPQHYDEEYQLQTGEKHDIRLIASKILESEMINFLGLIYEWTEELSEEEASKLSLRAIAYVSCAIYDAATAAGLFCTPYEIPNGRRPSWNIVGERLPFSLALSDIHFSEKTIEMSIGSHVTIFGQPPINKTLLEKLQTGFKEKFNSIKV